MSESILSLLNSDNPNERKKGIGAAAKSSDKRYLKPLAVIYKTDPDPTLRELAKKAGIYINKHQPAAVPAAPPPPEDDMLAVRDSLLANLPTDEELDEDDYEDVPPSPTLNDLTAPSMDELLPPSKTSPIDVPVPAVPGEPDPEQAEYHYNTAIEAHVQDDNGLSALELGTAFFLNPAYANNPTAVALAAELTGKPKTEAAAYIGNPENWEAIIAANGGIKNTRRRREIVGFALWIAGGIALLLFVAAIYTFLQSDLFAASLQQFTQETFGGLFEGGILGE